MKNGVMIIPNASLHSPETPPSPVVPCNVLSVEGRCKWATPEILASISTACPAPAELLTFTLLSPDVSVTACEFELSTEVNCTHFKEKGWCSYALSPIQFKSLLIQSELCLDSISPKLKIPQKTCFITCLMASSLSLLAFKTRENTWF